MEEHKISLSRKKTIAGYSILLFLILLAVRLNKELFYQVKNEFQNLSVYIIILTGFLGLAYRGMEGIEIYLLSKNHETSIKMLKGIEIAYAGAFFRVATLGGAGFAAKIAYLHRNGMEIGEGTGICLMQFIFYKVAVLLMGIAALVRYPSLFNALEISRFWIYLGLFICIGIVFLLLFIALNKRMVRFVYDKIIYASRRHKSWENKINSVFSQIELLQREASIILRNKKMCLLLLGLSILMQAIWYAIPCVVAGNEAVSVGWIFQGMAWAYLLAGAIPSPSGLGSLEVTFIYLLKSQGIIVQATLAILVFRFASMILPFIAGIFCILMLNRKKAKMMNAKTNM